MNAKVIVLSGKTGHKYEFLFNIHKSSSIDEQQIDSGFYEKYGALPKGTHHEMEIVSPNVKEFPTASKIHYYISQKNQKDFICWTGQLPTLSSVAGMTDMWCLGTVYTIETEEDFAKLFERYKINPNLFDSMINVLEKEYDINLYSHFYNM